jgi:hypothetical protein
MPHTRDLLTALIVIVLGLVISSCSLVGQNQNSQGTSWGQGAFSSNGEQIYFTATSDRGTDITYTAGPSSQGWMMMNGRLTCASCHGPDGRGGTHSMGMMQTMDAKDIRWSTLQDEFDDEKFKAAVEEGQDPDGSQLSPDMPRWKMSDEDLSDLIDYLKTLP